MTNESVPEYCSFIGHTSSGITSKHMECVFSFLIKSVAILCTILFELFAFSIVFPCRTNLQTQLKSI